METQRTTESGWSNGEPVLEPAGAEPRVAPLPSLLVVEDDGDIRDLLSTMLTLSGFAVQPCETAEEGLNALRTNRFDLVLTDYALPYRSGAWLLQQAQQEGLLDATPAMVVTAHPEPRDAEGFEIISKPFDVDALIERVRLRLDADRGGRRRAFVGPDHNGSNHDSHHDDCREPIELILYVNRDAPRSADALDNVRRALAAYADRVDLVVREVAGEPEVAIAGTVTSSPVLEKRAPGPRTLILGHLANPQVLLDLIEECQE